LVRDVKNVSLVTELHAKSTEQITDRSSHQHTNAGIDNACKFMVTHTRTFMHPNVSNVLTTSELYTTFKNGKDDASQPRAYFLTCEGARARVRACVHLRMPSYAGARASA
jgi:hypothetical protein